MKDSSIQIVEKPDWVSWDEIHEVLWNAHEQNRKKGVIMSYPSLSGEELKDMIGNHGKMFLALEDNKVVGTLALIVKSGKKWYNTGVYGYLCLGAVLPEYSGKGIYRSLYQVAETSAKQMKLSVLTRDTNENNARMLKITKQEGYHFDQGQSQSTIIIELKKALDERGLTDMQISVSDETSIDTQISSFGKLSDEAKKIVTRIDTHTYGLNDLN